MKFLFILLFSTLVAQADVESELRTFMKENEVEKMSFTLKNMKH